jgi:PITH domain
LPTIILFENGKETQRMKGADIGGLTRITSRFSEIAESAGSSSSAVVSGVQIPRGFSDVTSEIDLLGLDLLNADGALGSVRNLFSDTKPSGLQSTGDAEGKGKGKVADGKGSPDWVESDTDAQLMLFVPFQSTVKLHSLQLTSYASRDPEEDDDEVPARPKRIELYTNRSHTLGKHLVLQRVLTT